MSDAQASSLRWTPIWIVALAAAWPLPVLAQALLSLGVLAGLVWLLLRRSRGGSAVLSGPAWALTSVLFCAYWLPEVIAAVDTEGGWRAWHGVVLDLRWLPLMWLAAAAVAGDSGRRWAFAGLVVVALAWGIDGLLAVTLGHSLLHGLYANGAAALAGLAGGMPGIATDASHAIGALGSQGHWLAVACLSPFALGWAARKAPVAWWATALVFAAGIALSNAPAAWIAFACVLLLELLHKFNWRRAVGVLALALVGIGLVWAMAIHAPDRAATTRVQATLDAALASSRTSICQMRTHPINGVGTGALPSESSDCAADALAVSDADRNGVPLLLELPAQTGVIGLLLWLAGVALAWRAWRYADATARMRAWPALQALLAMLFPLNAGLPVYGGLWGSAILMMAGLYAGALWGRIETEPVRQS